MLKSWRIYLKIAVNNVARKRHLYINDKNFLMIAAMWVGLLSGLAAVVLRTCVHYLQHFMESGFNIRYENYLYLATPLVGIVLCVFVIRLLFKSQKFDKGLSSIIYSISRNNANVEKHKSFTHILTSALTVGLGGSVGLEAPIAVTGSSIGSNTAKDLLMDRQHRTLLLASGAAAGIAAIFNSPIAGVIFAFEVLLSEVTIPAFIPLLIASATGAVVSRLFGGSHIFSLQLNEWSLHAIPFYVLLSALCGLVSAYMIRTSLRIESVFNQRKQPYHKAIAGGLIIGLLLFIFPPLYGEGYGVVNKLLAGDYVSLLDRSLFYRYNSNMWFLLGFAITIVFVKVIASAVTIGSGGNGGIFGPSLFTGAMLGFVFATLINTTGIVELNTGNFVAVAMGGVISGVLHAPLTGIFLIAEITGGYTLFVPLMMVSAGSYFITRYFEPNSIYKKTLVERGMLLNEDNGLQLVSIRAVVEKDFITLKTDQTLYDLVDAIAHCRRNIFPVINENNELQGIVLMDEIREVMFKTNLYRTTSIAELMTIPPVRVDQNTSLDEVIKLFEKFAIWHIPVEENGKYSGMISKSGVLQFYREQLAQQEQTKVAL
ncbi:MAG: chloride channel protein [Bacteroidota bacterium]|jgi:CIC family chloride channel protein